MKSVRAEFSKSTKANAFLRCSGKCEGCFARLLGSPEYHHIVAAALGGSNDLTNCKVLCSRCHRIESDTVTTPMVSKSKRIEEKRMGIRTKRGGFRKAPAGWNTFTRTWRNE